MKNDLELAYVLVGSRNREALNTYLANNIGLMPAPDSPAGTSAWRMDERVHRLLVQDHERDDALALGFEASDQASFDATCARLRAFGAPLQEASAKDLAERQVRQMVRTQAPWGVAIELVTGLAKAAAPFASAVQPGGFVTHGRGMGHAVFTVGDQANYDATRRFVQEGLGLQLSDWLEGSAGPMPLHVSFYHCNPRHHTLAFAHIPIGAVPQHLHHLNFQVPDMDAVGLAYDRCLGSQAPIANTLGRHGNDKMFSFYGVTPGDWQIEVGCNGVEITEDWNAVIKWDRISDWGHQPPAALVPAPASAA